MALKMPNPDRFPKLTSQHQIDLEESWWKERFTIQFYRQEHLSLNWESFWTSISGYWWNHHQILIGTWIIEFTFRTKPIKAT